MPQHATELAKFARKWASKLDALGAAPATTLWRGFEVHQAKQCFFFWSIKSLFSQVVAEDEPLGTAKLHTECAQVGLQWRMFMALAARF